MEVVHLLKWLHIVGAAGLLGTGVGIAFFMLMAHRSADVAFIARTATVVVLADWLFTATAVVLQPVTGTLLAVEMGWPLDAGWILLSLAIYVIVGVCWLPVVALQRRMRDLAREAAREGVALPSAYHRLFRLWFALGIPGFTGVLAIIWLMVARPALG